MTLALIYGAGSGALHAVTGPDHVLSLGPVALRRPQAPWKIGLQWGLGHALGTLLLALPLAFWASRLDLSSWAAFGERLGGLALLLMAIGSAWSIRQHHRAGHRQSSVEASERGERAQPAPERRPGWIGLVHGLTGAGGLLLVLPVLISGSLTLTLTYLLAFAAGSTVAMAGLTAGLARLGQHLSGAVVTRLQYGLVLTSFGLGLAWLVSAG